MVSFILGAVTGGVIVFLVYGNNKSKANKVYEDVKEKVDEVKDKVK